MRQREGAHVVVASERAKPICRARHTFAETPTRLPRQRLVRLGAVELEEVRLVWRIGQRPVGDARIPIFLNFFPVENPAMSFSIMKLETSFFAGPVLAYT